MSNIIEYEVSESGKSGSSLQGYVTTTYDKLIGLLGKPTYMDADPYAKVNCEWVLEVKYFEEEGMEDYDYERETVTIYNWKDGRIPTEEYSWHVGGTTYNATDVVDMIVDNFNRNGENHNGEREYEKVS